MVATKVWVTVSNRFIGTAPSGTANARAAGQRAPSPDGPASHRQMRTDRLYPGGRRTTRRATVAAVVTLAALAAGGCNVSGNTSADLTRMPNISSQQLMRQLEQPTTPGPGGYEMLAGPQRLSLRGIQYTTQGRDALQSWLNSPTSKKATYKQAGHNLAIAFPGSKAEINRKLG